MSIYKQFETDNNLEVSGILLEYGFLPGEDGKPDESKPITIRIARAGGANQQFNKRLEFKTKAYRRQIQTETIDNKLLEKLLLETYAETVVLGWENMTTPTGEVLDFNLQNVIKLFNDLPDLYRDVQEQANKSSLFRKAIVEAIAGN